LTSPSARSPPWDFRPRSQGDQDTIGLPLPVALAQLIGTGPIGAADAVEIYRVLWRTHVTPRIPQLLYPGVREGLQELKRATSAWRSSPARRRRGRIPRWPPPV